ncbi:MAG: UvrD-helicase domain-containing protein [Planctomycetota bacterium]|nr:UvrD-helicase domain-containing protein [Planctomycetota bacterium]
MVNTNSFRLVLSFSQDNFVPPLNPPQQDAVSTVNGPMLVLAGAGTGKTRVVTYRIVNLIRRGVPPDRILGVTFTNKAASEMRERIFGLLGNQEAPDRPEISTFHSLCVKVLRRQIQHLGYPKSYSILDRGDQESIARSVLREIRAAESQVKPSELLWRISSWKSKSFSPADAAAVAETDKEHLCATGYRRYQRLIKNRGAVDFDDLLLLTDELFRSLKEVREQEASRYDHILVDEYQDTNQSQYQIVKALAKDHRNLCVVGDDDQAIYGWRGAEVEHILGFQGDWPDAKVIRLEQNYRSTGNILKLANTLIAFNQNRHDKELIAARPSGPEPPIYQFPNETQEAVEIVRSIRNRLSEPGVEPRDIAILFRTNEQPRVFEVELRKAKIPYVLLGGQSFFDRKEVRDILAYLKIISRPFDEVSLLRVINTPARGIGMKAIEIIMADSIENKRNIWDSLLQVDSLPGVPAKGKAAIGRFTQMIQRFQGKSKTENLASVARDLVSEINYRAELQRVYSTEEEQELKMNSVEEVVNALGVYGQDRPTPTLAGFLQETAIEDRDFDTDREKVLQRNSVALLTLHSAKGLEYPEVYMVGLEEGILPHHRSVEIDGAAIDEERRLCYVGVTRAQERLTLSLSLSRMKWGKPRETHPSRFLFEMIGKADHPNANSHRAKRRPKKR